MNPKDFFKQLGLGDDEMNEAREWVNYKHFSETIPDILSLNEYTESVWKRAVDLDAKPHQWFSERYMREKYLVTDIPATDEYIEKMNQRLDDVLERTEESPNVKFIGVCRTIVNEDKFCLSKECLVTLNKIYKGKE